MNATLLRISYGDTDQINLVIHKCSLAEFQLDMQKTADQFVKDNPSAGILDLLWHLDKECDARYGHCAWQILPIRGIMRSACLHKHEGVSLP